jgi:hypothetical protein
VVVWSLTSHDGLVDSLAVSIRDVGLGGNLEIQTNTIDMFVLGVGNRATFQGGLHQILVMLTAERYVPAVCQSDGNVVIVEKLTQRHEPNRSKKPRDRNVRIL